MNKENRLGIMILIVMGLFCGFIFYVVSTTKPYIEPVLKFNNPYLCIKNESKFIKVDSFNTRENIYICGLIQTNQVSFNDQISVYLFKNKLDSASKAYYYESVFVSKDDLAIPINISLDPGEYFVSILFGRKTICEISFMVNN